MDPEPTPDANAAVPPTTPVPAASASPAGPPGPPAPPAPPVPSGPPVPAHQYAAPPVPVRQYPAPIGWVIAAVILFWPTAIPALLASHRSARAAGAGDVVTADREAASAKRWGIVSVCVGAALVVLSVVVSILWALVVLVAVHDHRDGFWSDRDGSSRIQPYGRSDGSGTERGRGMPGMPGSGSGSGSDGSSGSGSRGSHGFGGGSGRQGFGQPGQGSGSGSGSGSATPAPSPTTPGAQG